MFVSAEVEAKFWREVDKTPGHGPNGDCWVMSRQTEPARYGRFHYSDGTGRAMDAHRFSLSLSLGRLPNGDARHTCHYRPCCRPDHLIEGTRQENMDDMVAAGRSTKGKPNLHNAKLSAVQVTEILSLKKMGLSNRKIAEKFGVWHTTIGNICRGERIQI